MANAENYEIAACLLVEGIPVAFWTREDAASSVTASGVERSTNHVGLEIPKTLAAGINLSDGWLTSQTATFKISDVDDTLADLFAAVRADREALTATIEPGDTVVNGSQTLRSRHIGTEYIGSGGERRQYPAFRDFSIGMRHPDDREADALALGAVPVTEKPLLWVGRRVALYEFRLENGAWQSWADAALIWWGTARGSGTIVGKEWSLKCNGADSLLRKAMGFAAWSEPESVDDAQILFGENERTVTAASWLRNVVDEGAYNYGEGTATIAGDTVSDVRAALVTVINAAADDDENDGQFIGSDNPGAVNEEPGGDIEVASGNAIRIRIKSNADTGRKRVAGVTVTMAEKAWRALGYDPTLQGDEALLNGDTPEAYVDFSVSVGSFGAPSGLPYYTARMTTQSVESILDGQVGLHDADNEGEWRTWAPIYGDADDDVYTLYAGGQQEVYLGAPEGVGAYCRGQHDMPAAEDPASPGDPVTLSGGGTVDSTRLFAFFGPRRAEGGEEYTETWVGRCSWRNSNGAIGLQNDANDAPTLYVSEWLDPAQYGFRRGNGWADLDADWLAPKGTISCVPLHHVTATADGYLDSPVRLARNMLVTTGTSGGWYTSILYAQQQFGAGGKLQPGENNPNLLFGQRPADADIEDLGLAIPRELVMSMQDAQALEGALPSSLKRVGLAYAGRFQAERALLGLTRPIGLAWSLRGGKYTIFDPTKPVSPDDVDHEITIESYAGADLPRQSLVYHEPIDVVRFGYSHNPIEQSTQLEAQIKATDGGARYRASEFSISIDAPGYHAGFGSALFSRWRDVFAFWGRRHFLVTADLHYDETIWPGDTVRWTDQSLTSNDGSYGVSGATGYVVERTHNYERRRTKVKALLVEGPATGVRMVAPSAEVVAYDSGTNTLFCRKDHRGVSFGGFDHIDVAAFAEPDWSTAGGNADVTVLQYDGVSVTTAGHGSVSSVSTADNTITLTGALSGGTGYYRDRDSLVVMRGHANQTAPWVLDLYAPIAGDGGAVNGDTADAVQWNEG